MEENCRGINNLQAELLSDISEDTETVLCERVEFFGELPPRELLSENKGGER